VQAIRDSFSDFQPQTVHPGAFENGGALIDAQAVGVEEAGGAGHVKVASH